MGLVWQSEHLTPSGWAAIGAKVGIAIKGYMHWTEAEGERVGINDMYQELVPTLRQQPTSAQVVDDSELVRDMIAYERRQQQSLQAQLSPITQVAVKPALHHGMVKDVSKIELHSV